MLSFSKYVWFINISRYAMVLAAIVGDGYAGRWKIFEEDGTGTIDFDKDDSLLKNIDRVNITISK